MKHILDSGRANKFFAKRGIMIIADDSSHNSITFKDTFNDKMLTIEAESDEGVAYCIPGIFVTKKEKTK